MATAEHRDLADLPETLTQWEAPSLCQGWRVRDVAVLMAITGRPGAIGELAGAGQPVLNARLGNRG